MKGESNKTRRDGADSRHGTGVALFAAYAVGLTLRLLLLGSKGFWLDEVQSILVARAGLEALINGTVEGYHPPLFYLLLKPWLDLVSAPFLLRLPSAVLGTLCLPATYILARDLFDESVARTSLWLAVLSPLLVWYSQELRSYSMLTLLAIVAMLSLTKLLQGPRAGWWLLFTASTTAATYTHYDAALLIPLQGLLVVGLLASRRAAGVGMGAWFLGLGVVLLTLIPWLRTPAMHGFLDILTSDRLYIAPLLERSLGIDYKNALPLIVLLAAGIVLLGWLIPWVLLRRYRSDLHHLRGNPWIRLSALCLFIVTLVLAVIPRGYTVKRHMIIAWPLILIGFAWVWPWRIRKGGHLVAALVLSLAATFVNIAAIPKPQWREAAQMVLAQQEPGDVVVLSPGYMAQTFDYYARQRIPLARAGAGDPPAVLTTLAGDYDRLWLAYHTTDVDPHRPAILQWLAENADRISTTEFHRVQVDLYLLR